MPDEPKKTAIVFFDVQNLYITAKELYGRSDPDFDPEKLASCVGEKLNCNVVQFRYYTGIPGRTEQSEWHAYWVAKNRKVQNSKIVKAVVITKELKYRYKNTQLPLSPESGKWARFILPNGQQLPRGSKLYLEDGNPLPPGTTINAQVKEEKGIDVRLALDLVKLTREKSFEVAVLFTQDQDHEETVKEAKAIAASQNRWIKLYSAFPVGAGGNPRGVNGTDWIPIDESTYLACLDPNNYRQGRR